MQVEEESPKQYVDIARVPDKEMRPERPVPLGLRPGRSSASLPGLTISTYGLRRAPRIRSVLATTHHAPIIELGSSASRKPRVTSRLLPAVLEALRRVFFVELAQHIVRLQPHHIDDPEREGEADTEYPREIPHADFLLIHGMGMLPDLFHRHLSAHHTVDPRRIRDDDRQHQDYHPEHDMQRPMARHGVPHGEAALRAAARGHDERKQGKA